MKLNLFASGNSNWVAAFSSITFLMFILLIPAGEAGIFSYKDENGKTHYTDDLSKIPSEYRESDKKVRKHKEARKDPGPISSSTVSSPILTTPIEIPGSPASRGEIQIPLEAHGNSYFLDVVLNGSVTAKLLLDTGASEILLSKEVAGKLGFNFASVNAKQTASTANGDTTVAAIALETVQVGNAKSYVVEAMFNESYNDNDGLLGMSFLGDYRFEIDRSKSLLILKPQTTDEMEWGG